MLEARDAEDSVHVIGTADEDDPTCLRSRVGVERNQQPDRGVLDGREVHETAGTVLVNHRWLVRVSLSG